MSIYVYYSMSVRKLDMVESSNCMLSISRSYQYCRSSAELQNVSNRIPMRCMRQLLLEDEDFQTFNCRHLCFLRFDTIEFMIEAFDHGVSKEGKLASNITVPSFRSVCLWRNAS